MKKLIKTVLVTCVGAAAFSCDSLDQKALSSFDARTVYSNETLTRYNVNSIYEAYTASYSYKADYFMYYGLNTDVEGVVSKNNNEMTNICRYDISPTCTKLNYADNQYLYSGNFAGIEKANICIDGLRRYGDIRNNPRMAALYGEALTVRALLYADLLNVYGEVPARFEPITAETAYLPKSDKDIIYKQLLSDLEEAAGYMDYADQKVITQAGKACANGLYARLALQAAGFSCRPDDGEVNTGAPGTVRKSYDPDLQADVLYPKALKACEDIIENAGLSLFDNFGDLWHFYCNLRTEAGGEIIFGLPMGSGGTHIKRNCIPDAHAFSRELTAYNGVQPNLYFRYDPADTRRDITCYPCKIGEDGKANGAAMSINQWYYGKFRVDWMEEHPMADRESEDCGKFTYMRYADILLMAAELANELSEEDGGGLEKAKSYMEPVLKRAFHNDAKVEAYMAGLTDRGSFFAAVKEQRGFEFAGEMLRRTDLIRWGCLRETLDECKADLENLRYQRGRYAGMNDVLYWRIKDNGVDIELYGTNPSETENKVASDPAGGWKAVNSYYSKMASTTYNLMYLQNPDEKMYRPIPATIIIANMGVLVNDYGYTF